MTVVERRIKVLDIGIGFQTHGVVEQAEVQVAILRLCSHHEEEPKFTPRDYPEIIDSGILRAVTEYNTISYHADKDSLSGFDYELLNVFAQAKNLRLEVTPEMSFEERLKGLNKGSTT